MTEEKEADVAAGADEAANAGDDEEDRNEEEMGTLDEASDDDNNDALAESYTFEVRSYSYGAHGTTSNLSFCIRLTYRMDSLLTVDCAVLASSHLSSDSLSLGVVPHRAFVDKSSLSVL